MLEKVSKNVHNSGSKRFKIVSIIKKLVNCVLEEELIIVFRQVVDSTDKRRSDITKILQIMYVQFLIIMLIQNFVCCLWKVGDLLWDEREDIGIHQVVVQVFILISSDISQQVKEFSEVVNSFAVPSLYSPQLQYHHFIQLLLLAHLKNTTAKVCQTCKALD
jgi:hypothetical protein